MGTISRNFSYAEFEASPTAQAKGVRNVITSFEVRNAVKELVDRVLQPLRDKWGKALTINSGYRCPALNALVGGYVNLAYPLPSGAAVKFLNDRVTYLGNQLEPEFGGDRCFGVLANMDFIMICTYGENGADPELLLYKKR